MNAKSFPYRRIINKSVPETSDGHKFFSLLHLRCACWLAGWLVCLLLMSNEKEIGTFKMLGLQRGKECI